MCEPRVSSGGVGGMEGGMVVVVVVGPGRVGWGRGAAKVECGDGCRTKFNLRLVHVGDLWDM